MARILTKCCADLTVAPFGGPSPSITAYTLDSGSAIKGRWTYTLSSTLYVMYMGSFFSFDYGNGVWIQFYDSTGTRTCYVSYNDVSKKLVLYNNAGTILSTSTGVININTVYHAQFCIDCSYSAFQIKLDGVSILSYSGSIGSNINSFEVYGSGFGYAAAYMDAIVINDTTTSCNNTWPGIRRLKIQTPTSDGYYTSWSKSNVGVDAYTLVDNKPPTASEYIYAQTNGLNESFGISAHSLPTLASVQNVIEQFYAYKNTNGQIKIGSRIGGVDYLSAALDVGVSGNIYQYSMPVNPATGLAWLQADLNTVEPVIQSVI